MNFRPAILILSAALLFASGTGCRQSQPSAPVAPPTILSPATAAHVHWLGKKRLGITASAYYFTRIWQFSQGARLERQTLTKLATTPGQWLPGGTNLTEDAVARLWLVFNDLVQEESYLEIRAPANPQLLGATKQGEGGSTLNPRLSLVFAIRLNEAQSDSWLTNLPALLQPLTGARAVNNPGDDTWSLKTTNVLNFVQFTRVGEWTVLSAGPEQNLLAGEITARIRRDRVPFVSAGTNLWLEASLDLPRLVNIFPLSASGSQILSLVTRHSSLSSFHLSLSGDGANVITRANLTLTQPLPASLEPWRLPVELMHEPLTSFTAARGLQSWLAAWQPWRDLQIGTAPDQLFSWSLAGSPYQIYLAAPLLDAKSQVAALTDQLLQKGNPWLATNGYISFDRASDGNGVTWGDLPDIKPFIKSTGAGVDGWLFAGLFPDTNNAATPPPAGMIQDVLRRTNLVYYDWEVTGPRLQPGLQVAQTARLIARQPQMSMDSASIGWLAMLVPRLGISATIINRTGPAELTLYRRSTIGLTALELHLLADWLESPQFPHM
ncbi:MAG: hypothetical protein PHY43_14365 [Verrucomicrobiales bacterium]|nr:hypothetical protein [Verrucomicrobiales bacterium]